MIQNYFSLAFKNLRKRGLRSWLTILGIFIGIAAVVALISMGQGLQEAVTSQFGTLSLDRLTIQNKGTGFGPPGSTVVEKLNDNDLKIIENIQGVEAVIPRLIRVGKLEYNKISGFGYGTDVPDEKKLANLFYETLGVEAEQGRLLEPGDRGKIMLGNFFLETNDFEKPFLIEKNVLINDFSFEIIGILEKSSSIQLNGIIYMNTKDMQNLFETKGEYDLIVAKVQDKNQIEDIAKEIERKLRNDRNEKLGEETFTVETPLQSLESVNTILNIINIIVVGIAMISLFVGGVGIANTMYTSVVERTREIGVMKAIGAQNKDVLMIFLIESGMLGLVGGSIGSLIGIGIAFGASSIASQALGINLFRVSANYGLLIGAVGFSFFVGIISGIFPAMQASKLNVVDALRS
ncbi:MAG: ABC transporter permease [Nanoarchaeota archaeon]|nr:ABC transporter permease [Nanoarchaeota archaeon]MBU1028025.1 ABC transporter permease [Nanoarchaeota archaeon]